MGMHFTEKRGRENFIRCSGGEKNLAILENHFQKWPFSKKDEDTLKRFFVREPEGRDTLIHFLDNNPKISLKILSSESLSDRNSIGEQLFSSKFYVMKLSLDGLVLVEDNTNLMDLMKYVF